MPRSTAADGAAGAGILAIGIRAARALHAWVAASNRASRSDQAGWQCPSRAAATDEEIATARDKTDPSGDGRRALVGSVVEPGKAVLGRELLALHPGQG